MRHELKTDMGAFQAVYDRLKTHELRLNDRDYNVGDVLVLRETAYNSVEMAHGAPLVYTGRIVERRVTHVLRGPIYGLANGWIILSVAD